MNINIHFAITVPKNTQTGRYAAPTIYTAHSCKTCHNNTHLHTSAIKNTKHEQTCHGKLVEGLMLGWLCRPAPVQVILCIFSNPELRIIRNWAQCVVLSKRQLKTFTLEPRQEQKQSRSNGSVHVFHGAKAARVNATV